LGIDRLRRHQGRTHRRRRPASRDRVFYRRFGGDEDEVAANVWLDGAWTSCDELDAEGGPGVILVIHRGSERLH
jgi:hypothetical protein